MRGKHLRVSYPDDSGSGYTLLTKADGTKTGSVVEFMRSIARDVGFTWEIVPVGEDSKALFSSSFTACVHSVAIGATDVSILIFWRHLRACRSRLAVSHSSRFTPMIVDVHWQLLGNHATNTHPPGLHEYTVRR